MKENDGKLDDSEAIPNGWPFLGQAAQVVKMVDLGAILNPFCAKLPKLSKWMIRGPWAQYINRD